MKTNNLLMAVSVIALLGAAPAMAQSYSSTTNTQSNTISGKMDQGWNSTKQAVSNTMTSTKSTMSRDVVKADLLPNQPGATATPVSIDKRMTAAGIIGKPVYNQKNERVATVADVILDSSGRANMIVVKDSSFLGFGGKLAAFDYNSVIDRKKDGDIVMPITKKVIDNVAEFSYKASDNPSVRVLPPNGFSMKKIMDGNLLDPAGKKLAAIDNVTLRNGRANLIIAAFHRFLGMGGDKIALDFKASELVKDRKNNVDLKLDADQARDFETFKANNK
jgi:sporulation protein YlmC with PRC-barrel domain